MSVEVIIGAQWGDEAKGKMVDATKADLYVKYNGGANAGHRVVNEFGEFSFRLTPSGIFNPDALCAIADTVFVDPFAIEAEMKALKEAGIDFDNRKLLIDPNAHLVMPWHKMRDGLEEVARGGGKLDTTKQGIGPTAADRAARVGLKVGDLLRDDFTELFEKELLWQERLIRTMKGEAFLNDAAGSFWKRIMAVARAAVQQPNFDKDKILDDFGRITDIIGPKVSHVVPVIHEYYDQGKRILGEGAQGVMLDLDQGTYPYVTSSHPGVAGFILGTRLPPQKIDRVIGVAKAYVTRVGNGPMTTELPEGDPVGDYLVKNGHEYGTNTNRRRRPGFENTAELNYAIDAGGATELAIAKLDVLSGIPELKICWALRVGNELYTKIPTGADAGFFRDARPIYKQMRTWDEDIRGVRDYADLPPAAKEYIEEIERLTGKPVTFISVAPEREALIKRAV